MCETSSFTPTEEHRLRVYENRIEREISGFELNTGAGKLQNEDI